MCSTRAKRHPERRENSDDGIPRGRRIGGSGALRKRFECRTAGKGSSFEWVGRTAGIRGYFEIKLMMINATAAQGRGHVRETGARGTIRIVGSARALSGTVSLGFNPVEKRVSGEGSKFPMGTFL